MLAAVPQNEPQGVADSIHILRSTILENALNRSSEEIIDIVMYMEGRSLSFLISVPNSSGFVIYFYKYRHFSFKFQTYAHWGY